VPKVLVCDDEAVMRALIRATLEADFEIVEVTSGDATLERTRAERPDLIVLDMMMPGTSGLDVLSELRGDSDLASIPVLMLTARTQSSDRDAALRAGADRFLAKPFSPIELAGIVGELVSERD
jgi:DNA-binding response OmpR family regulator